MYLPTYNVKLTSRLQGWANYGTWNQGWNIDFASLLHFSFSKFASGLTAPNQLFKICLRQIPKIAPVPPTAPPLGAYGASKTQNLPPSLLLGKLPPAPLEQWSRDIPPLPQMSLTTFHRCFFRVTIFFQALANSIFWSQLSVFVCQTWKARYVWAALRILL